jgi:uncharacterized membrane protein YdjX (TVP38/TMEM64 family)
LVALEIVQVMVSVLPGQAVQIAAGYAYNFWVACLITFAGIGLGTLITFYLAKLLGSDAMHLIFGDEKFRKYVRTLNSKRAFIIIFIIFLIPGIPKDLFVYAAGVSEMKASAFLLLSMVARAPALMASLAFGGMLKDGSYVGMVVMGAAVAVLAALGLKFRSKITEWADRAYCRLTASGQK